MKKINFNNYTSPVLSKSTLMQLQDNIEEAIENKLILNKTLEADTTDNIILMNTMQEGLYQFIIEGYLPANSAFYFENFIDVTKFDFSVSHIRFADNTTNTMFWSDASVATNLPIAAYNTIFQKQISQGTFEIRNNVFSYSRNTQYKTR